MPTHHSQNTRKSLVLPLLIIGLFVSVFSLFASDTPDVIRYLVGNGGATHNPGIFCGINTPDSCTTGAGEGNPGLIKFGQQPTDAGYSGGMAIGGTLTGYFWVDTIGWVGLENVEFIPAASGSPRDPWTLSGYAWADSAGWIDFSNSIMYPDTLTFSGYAWNDGIGWINMVGAKLGTISDGIVSKVKILGSIGGSQIFDTTYNVGESFGSVTMSTFIDKVRKNATLLSRNVPSNLINTNFATTNTFENKAFYINNGGTAQTLRYSTIRDRFVQSPMQSIIVMGGDVYIDEDVLPVDSAPRAIIALRDSSGNYGNIYINGNVRNIKSSLVAEGTVYSGYLPSPMSQLATLYNPTVMSTMTLPGNQLYVYGTIISHNTIGGSAQNGNAYSCPYTEIICNRDNAVRYDLNFFRGYDKQDPNITSKRAYPTSAYDDFSFIIEYNPLVQTNPPPGLYDVKQ